MSDSHPLADWIEQNSSRAAFARDVDCSISHLTNILARRKRPSLDLLNRIADKTGGKFGADAFKASEAAQ